MAISWQDLNKQETLSTEDNETTAKQDVEIASLEEQVEKKLKEKEHKARSWLTISFLLGLFSLIIGSAWYVIYHNQSMIELAVYSKEHGLAFNQDSFQFLSFESVFSLIFNSFGTSLGFIIGYYFKEKLGK
ncbi:hypothetical protein R7D66_23575 [Vibrio sp. Vb2354]|uniref:hypothetical protein n=1 Tax=unclassified Vibrio TaxID=2614977 RepID=UPI0029641D93|nr:MULTISPECIES: hypothetical protein [unclassified Vibrio]MDW1741500.1 hypothetical protein [Vibrio sp. Vb2321]MDW1760589.1 hypothetical protein [Vibrio sp. Vb2353]MDW1774871.1 hypothetical protein [Vibrio sp. Vb2354]MDW1810522.1 hypothetical protein [Vibrio sp. Vb2362]